MGKSKARKTKQYERFLLECFLRAEGIQASVVDGNNEAPDFLIRVDRELIGVELTELFVEGEANGGPLQAQEEIAWQIVRKAEALYRAGGGAHAHVSIHFSGSSDLRRLKRDETAAQLATFVLSQALRPDEDRPWEQGVTPSALPQEIGSIDMRGVPEEGMGLWTVLLGGWMAPLTTEILQARVDAKAQRLPRYRERVERNWLVIVSDAARPSQFFLPPTPAVAHDVSSPFTRTFYFGRGDNIVVEIGVPASSAGTEFKDRG